MYLCGIEEQNIESFVNFFKTFTNNSFFEEII